MFTKALLTLLILILSVNISISQVKSDKKKKKYVNAAFTIVNEIKVKQKTKEAAKYSYFLVNVGAFETLKNFKTNSQLRSYLVVVENKQLISTANAALKDIAKIGSSINTDKIKAEIREKINKNISGAFVEEVRPEQLERLLGGKDMRLPNSRLARDGADDFIQGALMAGGAFASVAGTSTAQFTMAEAFTLYAGPAAGHAVLVASAGYGSYQATRGLLEMTGANSGYTLADFAYDLTHPNEPNNPIWGGSGSENDSRGTTLPPEFGGDSSPGGNIILNIILGLSFDNAIKNNVVIRPVTLASQPSPLAEGLTNIDLLLRFDAMLGGSYFKLVERALSSRQNSNRTTNPINETSSGGPMIVDYTKCPPADFQAMKFNNYLKSSNGRIQAIRINSR